MNKKTTGVFSYAILVLVSVICWPQLSAAELITNFEHGNFLVPEDDREFSITISDVAREIIKQGETQGVAQAFPGLAIDTSYGFNSFMQVMPVLPVPMDGIRGKYENTVLDHAPSSFYSDRLNAFNIVYETAITAGVVEVQDSNEDAFQSYLRGTILLDTQLNTFYQSMGNQMTSGAVESCWWPFCPIRKPLLLIESSEPAPLNPDLILN